MKKNLPMKNTNDIIILKKYEQNIRKSTLKTKYSTKKPIENTLFYIMFVF